MSEESVRSIIELAERSLLTTLNIWSENTGDPIRVDAVPDQWELLGAGNYAGVFMHKDYPELAVKVYAPTREGWEDEREVYRLLGSHPAYSKCYYAGVFQKYEYLILKRLIGKTLYQCVLDGEHIPVKAIEDIDEALDYAASRGLNPHDVHGKNVMLSEGRGLVVDVSDFLKDEDCLMWDDLKRAYYRIYVPFLSKKLFKVPEWVMNSVRKGYRFMRHSS